MTGTSAPTVGTLVDGRYTLLSVLGEGGFGVVYRARQESTGQIVAVKLLWPTRGGTRESVEARRFLREIQLVGRLRHPHIVRLIDSGVLDDGSRYMVLTYIEGRTLDQTLRSTGPLSPRLASHLMTQVLDALHYAHARGFVHRDLKPHNIMITEGGIRPNATVLDFGIAGLLAGAAGEDEGVALTETGDMVGTPVYMAPEQIAGEPVGPETDLFSWGLIFIECLTGERVVKASSAMQALVVQAGRQRVELPPPLAASPLGPILERVTLRDRTLRYADAAEVLTALAEVPPEAMSARPLLPPPGGAVDGAALTAGTDAMPDMAHATPDGIGRGSVDGAIDPGGETVDALARSGIEPASLSDPPRGGTLAGRPAPPDATEPSPPPAVQTRGALAETVDARSGAPDGIATARVAAPRVEASDAVEPDAPTARRPQRRPQRRRSRWPWLVAAAAVLAAGAWGLRGGDDEAPAAGEVIAAGIAPDPSPQPAERAAGESSPVASPVPSPIPSPPPADGPALVTLPAARVPLGLTADERAALTAAFGETHALDLADGVAALPAAAFDRPALRVMATELPWRHWRAVPADDCPGAPPPPGPPDHPVTGVTPLEAERACAALGLRLPSDREWEAIARGPGGRAVPIEGDATAERLAAPLGPVGARPYARTPEGIADLAGNAREWVRCTPGAPAYCLGGFAQRGGAAGDAALWWRAALTHPPLEGESARCHRSPKIGFRCVGDAIDPIDTNRGGE